MDVETIPTLIGIQQLARIQLARSSRCLGNPMSWKPITQEDLYVLLQSCINEMSAVSVALFQKYAVQPYQLSCVRTTKTGQEVIFVVAHIDEKVLVFDDVEDEFGIGTIPQNGVLDKWQLYGTLETALNVLQTR
jgi:hypothetical protein